MSTPDYYKILDVSPTATQQQIRDAYKKAALKHHPDRVPADSPDRASRTKRFQMINDAYYTLCDPTRRREYDAARKYNNYSGGFGDSDPEEEIPQPNTSSQQGQQAGAGFGSFPWSSFFGSGANANPNTGPTPDARSNEQFGNVFEEMLREEGMAEGERAQPTGKFWSMVGGLSGGAMGFIIANFAGAVAGVVAGSKLGAVRDARGKSVYAVFQELPQADKARMLSDLASKVFAHAVGS
ncbi:dnaJ chaperone-like protein [Phyllosticta capitalensis]